MAHLHAMYENFLSINFIWKPFTEYFYHWSDKKYIKNKILMAYPTLYRCLYTMLERVNSQFKVEKIKHHEVMKNLHGSWKKYRVCKGVKLHSGSVLNDYKRKQNKFILLQI